MDNELQQLAKTDRNPVQESRYQQLLQQAGQPYFKGGNGVQTSDMPFSGNSNSGNFSGVGDPVSTAQKLLDFQKQANQPAVQTLQGQIDPLKAQYGSVLDSIRGQQQTAVNQTTLTTANELGARGLLPNSTYGQQQIEQSLLPVNSQYNSLYSQAGLAQQQDIMNINNAISQLQAGETGNAVSGALNIYGVQQGAANLQSQLAGALAQIKAQNEGQIKAIQTAPPYVPIQMGGGLLNTSTGNVQTIGGNSNLNLNAPNTPFPSTNLPSAPKLPLSQIFGGGNTNSGGFSNVNPSILPFIQFNK